ncbi:DNA alkylation repair protein [bacterium]|nr:DNA alkylation repair protein [bacterium]
MYKQIKNEIIEFADKKRAEITSSFFKTSKGEYGEGDLFLGVRVPVLRQIAKKYKKINFKDLEKLLNTNLHEYRFIALVLLIDKYKKGDNIEKKGVYDFYIKNLKNINNWDLVDISAPHIVGNYLEDKDRAILYKLVNSKNLWFRRVAIISTFSFIRNNDFKDCLKITEILLNDEEDLIHKAVGWMLREIGNRDLKTEEEFLKKYYKKIPRTTLRYAIEKFEEKKRQKYLKMK